MRMFMKFRFIKLSTIVMIGMLFILKPSWADNAAGVPVIPRPAYQNGEQPFELETGFGFENLSTGNTWREYYVSGSKVLGKNTGIYGTVRDTNRFNIDDQEALLGGYTPLAATTTLGLFASGSSGHVLAQYSVGGTIDQALGGGNAIEAGYQYRKYTPTGVNMESGTFEHYFSDNVRLAYTATFAQLTQTGGGSAESNAITMSYYYNTRNTFNLVYVFGNEVDSAGPGTVQILNVHGASLYGIHWFTSDFAISYGYEVINEAPAYTRNGPRLGVRFRF